MDKLKRQELYSLEDYAEVREQFRAKVMAYKKNRNLAIGPHVTLYFEDRLTIQYQIQEMLRIERIFEATAIEEELATYNPLIPDGHNWKATMMLEYADVDVRRRELIRLMGIEKSVWCRIGEYTKINPVADEDLQRETEHKTSAVHFLRFELTNEMVNGLKAGEPLTAGIEHESYSYSIEPIPDNIKEALLADLD